MAFTLLSPTRRAERARPLAERAFRWDRMVVAGGLAGISLLSWVCLLWMTGSVRLGELGPQMLAARPARSAGHDLALLCGMWAVMMVAMMVPAVTPTVLMFARLNRSRHHERAPYRESAGFLGGYLALWAVFSLLAGAAQWTLQSRGLIGEGMAAASTWLGGSLLVGAGVYQWTPLKNACLIRCRSPLSFLMTRWKDGAAGAFRMGAEHGSYCVACCWLLMLLLFVAGVMNPVWMGAMTALVLIEKLAPAGGRVARMSGVLFAGWGACLVGLALLKK
jgi:predicted metal-binding membrane protein